MIIETAIRKSHYYNEDRFIIGQNYALVLDGATSLEKNDQHPTSGSWFASFIKKKLKYKENDIISSLEKISVDAYRVHSLNLVENNLSYIPSAGLAFAVFGKTYVDIYTIGDCGAYILFKDGRHTQIKQKELTALDNGVLAKMVKISKEKNIPLLDTRRFINNDLITNRKKANQIGGYSVFAVCDKPRFIYKKERFDISELKEILLCTDGFASSWEVFELYNSYLDAFASPLKETINKIALTAYKDKNCDKYPRFKTIDDITAIKITF
ncbi:MAG TPA: protein phosphatase 2C domain-containing protein [Bacilli bacterium]|nr:protein phosphatase 2C domain-containing protein [Bacilli bacterium]